MSLYMLCIHTFLLNKSTHVISCLIHSTFNIEYWWRFFQQQPFHVRDPVLCDLFKPGTAKTHGRGLSCWQMFFVWRVRTSRCVILKMTMRYEILNELRNRWNVQCYTLKSLVFTHRSFVKVTGWLPNPVLQVSNRNKKNKTAKRVTDEDPTTSGWKSPPFVGGFLKMSQTPRLWNQWNYIIHVHRKKNHFPHSWLQISILRSWGVLLSESYAPQTPSKSLHHPLCFWCLSTTKSGSKGET